VSSIEQPGVTPSDRTTDDAAGEPSPARQARSGYLAFVAHEMRNPLATALWSAELLARLSPEDRAGPRGEKLAGMCLRTLARLRHLVEDHFLAERLVIDGLPIRHEAIELREAADTAAGRVPNVRYEAKVEGVVVMADRAMLERTLEALIAAASRDGAEVTLWAEPGDEGVEIHVAGAPPPEDAFRMPDRSTPSDPTGRALALLMARSVAQAHAGELRVSPDGYVLSLPVRPAREER
jgi:signal transduction histidine kinase